MRKLTANAKVRDFNPCDLTLWNPPWVKPRLVGEYNASIFGDGAPPSIRRWWNGAKWSDYYFPGERHPTKLANEKDQEMIFWRGLNSPHEE